MNDGHIRVIAAEAGGRFATKRDEILRLLSSQVVRCVFCRFTDVVPLCTFNYSFQTITVATETIFYISCFNFSLMARLLFPCCFQSLEQHVTLSVTSQITRVKTKPDVGLLLACHK